MATKTAGSKATTSLTALVWQPSGMNTTDLATLNADILNQVVGSPQGKRAWIENGILFLPDGRGQIQLTPGDYIAVDALGWPIVIPVGNMASVSSSWTHS